MFKILIFSFQDKGFTFPATEATAENVMASEPDMYKNLSFPATFENYFEVTASYISPAFITL